MLIRRDQLSALEESTRARRPGTFQETLLERLQSSGARAEIDPNTADVVAKDSRGAASRVRFSPGGLPAGLENSGGRGPHFSHDAQQRLSGIRFGDGGTVEIQRDTLGRICGLKRGNGSKFRLEYAGDDPAAPISALRFPDGRTRTFEYDAQGEPVRMINAHGAVTRRDRTGEREWTVTDPLGRTTVFQGHESGDLQGIRFPDGTYELYEWPQEEGPGTGRIRLRDGREVLFELDEEGRIERTVWPDEAPTSTVLDPENGVVVLKHVTEPVVLRFSGREQLLEEIDRAGATRYEYDEDGRLIRLTLAGGESITYGYDPDGRVESVSAGERMVARIAYTQRGQILSIDFGGVVQEQRTYNDAGSLVHVVVRNRNRQTASEQKYDYDLCDRLVQVADSSGPGPASPRSLVRNVEYDAESRVVAEVDTTTRRERKRYAYDAKGNLIALDGVSMEAGKMDEPLSFGTFPLAYDGLGNMVTTRGDLGQIQCEYSASGAMRTASTCGVHVVFTYDAAGRRVSKTEGGHSWRFGWSGHNLQWEERQTPGGPGSRRVYFHLHGHTVPLAFQEQGRLYFCQSDVRGAVIRVFDEHGRVVWGAFYDSYGLAQPFVARIRQPWRLLGQYHDEETGLHYSLSRYYNPRLGVFLSRDPEWLENESGGYSYCGGDPWNLADSGGADWEIIWTALMFYLGMFLLRYLGARFHNWSGSRRAMSRARYGYPLVAWGFRSMWHHSAALGVLELIAQGLDRARLPRGGWLVRRLITMLCLAFPLLALAMHLNEDWCVREVRGWVVLPCGTAVRATVERSVVMSLLLDFGFPMVEMLLWPYIYRVFAGMFGRGWFVRRGHLLGANAGPRSTASRILGRDLNRGEWRDEDSRWSGFQAQHLIPHSARTHPIFGHIGMDMNTMFNGIFLPDLSSYRRVGGSTTPELDGHRDMARHQLWHDEYNAVVRQALDAIVARHAGRPAAMEYQLYALIMRLREMQELGIPIYVEDSYLVIARIRLWLWDLLYLPF